MKTGKEIWRSNAIDYKPGYSMTVAPLVADGVVITGISGAEYGIRGFIDGWDPETGKQLWRTYTVAGPGDPGGDTLAGRHLAAWRRLDLDHRLLRSGAAHRVLGHRQCRVVEPEHAQGDNLYTCSVLALDPKTGKIKWHFQFSPNDPYDYDSVAEMVLADHAVERQADQGADGRQPQRLLLCPRPHERKAARRQPVRPKVTWARASTRRPAGRCRSEIDGAGAGRRATVEVWPGAMGTKNWSPMSFNPRPAWSTPTRC